MERRRIAWDVHVDSIQAMVAIGMRLQLLADRLPGEHADALRTLDDSVAGAIDRLRSLVFRLRPPAIDHEGLAAVLAGHLADSGLPYTLHYGLDREPPSETAITIFRICQEALTNVARHAAAHHVEASVAEQRGGVLVRVIDDGVGLDPEADPWSSHEHFGLLEMRERAETADGWWTIHGDPGKGTVVEFWLPLPPPEAR
jgi:signal transduction histidine kinase